MKEQDCRTIALEVGMQNGGLASGIALEMGKVSTVGLAPAVFGPWMNISGSDSVFRLARQIQHMRRHFVGGDTRIGDAIRFAASELTGNSIESRRMVIDIAGDGGIENMGIAAAARDDATDQGITINGLAIENEISELAGFFRENVIGGEDAFVIRTTSYAHFAVAMRRKLFREITNSPLAMLQDR